MSYIRKEEEVFLFPEVMTLSDETFNSWHEDRIEEVIDKLNEDGYRVVRIDRKSKSWGGFFGKNVTDIYFFRTK